MGCCVLLRLTCRMDKRENESAVIDGLSWDGMIGRGISPNNWAKGRLIVVELHSEIGGSEEDCSGGRKAGVRGFSGTSGKMRWSPVEGLPIVERIEMCFESCILGVGYPKRLLPRWRILVRDCIVKIDWSVVVLFSVCDCCSTHGDVDVQE